MRRGLPLIVLVCGALVGLIGCGQKPPVVPAFAEQSFPHLPDATNVLAALNQKDYATTVSSLASLKTSVDSPEKQEEFRSLMGQVREQITLAAGADPKAAEALQALNMLVMGR